MLPFPVKYLGEELPEPRIAPTVGEHNEEVLREVLGYDAEKIAALREAGVFG
jgi:crotonobetainyl-CoA:carnitine CoA-transferase CaiB-like acyl-CoA transferase